MGTPLSSLGPGARGRIVRVTRDLTSRADRLAALGVSAGASVRVLQTFPGIVFECDQTELAVERAVAREIWVAVNDSEPVRAEATDEAHRGDSEPGIGSWREERGVEFRHSQNRTAESFRGGLR